MFVCFWVRVSLLDCPASKSFQVLVVLCPPAASLDFCPAALPFLSSEFLVLLGTPVFVWLHTQAHPGARITDWALSAHLQPPWVYQGGKLHLQSLKERDVKQWEPAGQAEPCSAKPRLRLNVKADPCRIPQHPWVFLREHSSVVCVWVP